MNVASGSKNTTRQMMHLVFDHVRGMWRYRWYALALSWIIALGAWAAVLMMPNTYKASARVYVDTQNVLRPLLKGLFVENDMMNEVRIMTRFMLSRPNLETVARKTDLDLRTNSKDQFDRLVQGLGTTIKINGGREGIYTISFTDRDRQKAEDVVRTLLDTFVEDALGSSSEDSAQAEASLNTQIREYEQRLRTSEERMMDFKKRNIGMMPGDRGDYYSRLQRAIDHAENIDKTIRIVGQRREQLEKVLNEQPETILAFAGDPIQQNIAALEERLANVRLEFTDRHPDVQRLVMLIEQLRQRQADVAATATREGTMSDNPVVESLRVQLNETNVELAELSKEFEEAQANIAELNRLVDVIPEVEAQLTRLNRDYEVVRSRYTTMLGRWENLQTAKRVKSGSDSVQFRIIDPPFADRDPVGPPRLLYITMAFFVALGGGIGLTFLLNQVQPVFNTRDALAGFTDFPVIGTVSAVQDRKSMLRRILDRGVLASAGLGLVGAYAVVLTIADTNTMITVRETLTRVLN